MHLYKSWLSWVCLSCLACSTIQTGTVATTIDAAGRVTKQEVQPSGLRISGKQVTELANPYFGMLVITIENTTSSWRHLQNVRVSLSAAALNESVIIPAGAELEAWVDATLTNSYFALQDIAFLMRNLGLRDWSRRVTEHRGKCEQPAGAKDLNTITALWANPTAQRSYLPDHLLEAPIVVPPALFAKRWLVLNTPADQRECIRGVDIEFDVDSQPESTHERVWVPIDNTGSYWQPRFCAK